MDRSDQTQDDGRGDGRADARAGEVPGELAGRHLSPTPTTSVVIVNWNTGALLARWVPELEPEVAAGRLEVIVVDNASRDGSAEAIRTRLPWVRLLALDRNLGYGAGANRGVQTARGTYLLILNGDARVTSAAIAALERHAELQPEALLAPAIRNDDGSPQRSISRVRDLRDAVARSTPAGSLDLVRRRRVEWDYADPTARPIPPDLYPWGAAYFLPRLLFAVVGGFDEGFFLFYEDADLCRRLLDGGARLWYVPAAVVHHARGLSRRKAGRAAQVHYYRSQWRFLAKWQPRFRPAPVRALFAALFLLDLAYDAVVSLLRHGRPARALEHAELLVERGVELLRGVGAARR